MKVLDPCKKASGTVVEVRNEEDGDLHVNVRPDPAYKNLLIPGNYSGENGDLVVEMMARDGGHLPEPAAGQHLDLVGAYVNDLQHDWTEIQNDELDAFYVALAALQGQRLRSVDEEEHATAMRLLSERREDLVQERTRALNRLHTLLRELLPGGVPTRLHADEAARALRRVRSGSAPMRTRRQLATELVRDMRRLDRLVSNLDHRIREAVAESGASLTEVFGVGSLLAAKIVGRVGSVARFPTQARFASYTGTAPMEASSGDLVRHRLSRSGDRQLNSALHIIAVCQVRYGGEGGNYYRRKLAEGKSRKEALRCLKRRLSDVVFKKLSADLAATISDAV